MDATLRGNFEIAGLKFRSFVGLDREESEMIRTWRNHPKTREFMYNNSEISTNEHAFFISSLARASDKGYWLILDDASPLGTLSLTRINLTHKHAYLGIYVNPFAKAKGRGERLMRALISLAFERCCLHALRLEVMSENRHAIALYEKLGFLHEGILRDYVRRENGEYHSVVVMSLINQ